jgi:hypothetical protein
MPFSMLTSVLPAIVVATLGACGWACGSAVGVITKVGQRTSGRRLTIDHAVTFGSAGACLERIDNESLHKIDPIGRIKRLPHRPKFGQVAPVGARRGLVDDVRALCRCLPSFGISIRTRRKDQRRDLLRIGGGGLNVRPEQ